MRNGDEPVRVLVLKTDGVNCDAETAFAFRQAGAQAAILHINQLRERKATLADYDILAIAGGFSYGDDIASGRILAGELVSHLADQIHEFMSRKQTLVIGICNGFQVLVRAGLLPFGSLGEMSVTLAHNSSGHFECRWVNMIVEDTRCVFTKGLPREICLPVAHGEGRFDAPAGVLQEVEGTKLAVLRYSIAGAPTQEYPANPNGSAGAIAGICDPTGRVFGLMPHPERFVEQHQHPNWRRGIILPFGQLIFASAVGHVREAR